ncbi:hypothetical protein BC835DRAFT_955893 [Cytidiella melzeri]|nr:hypothetical protein BC835DRAFT_955893 [Cytidiella melzeri]
MLSTMATAAFRNSSLCELCHIKPKHGGHPFCGKTCATQAATLCVHCYQKPKFGTYEYCGKNCAAQAQAQPQPKSQIQTVPTPQTVPLNVVKQAVNTAKKVSAAPARQAPTSRPFQPLQQPTVPATQIPPMKQWVNVAAAHVPHILSTLNPPQVQSQVQPPAAPVPPTRKANQAPLPPTKPAATNDKSAQRLASGLDPQAVSSPTVLEYPDSPAVCHLPGCEEYAHVDSYGEASEYCSRAHREEAVDTGLVDPCIKCLIMPQSKGDYFCGRICREEALHKASAMAPTGFP